jgi:VanZ family protein
VTRWLRDWGPALLWAASIFMVSSLPHVPVRMEHNLDKVFHYLAYVLFGAALSWGGARREMTAAAVAAIGIVYGGSDEIHQLFVPGRSSDVRDWIADSLGVATGVALCLPYFARRLRAARSRMP